MRTAIKNEIIASMSSSKIGAAYPEISHAMQVGAAASAPSHTATVAAISTIVFWCMIMLNSVCREKGASESISSCSQSLCK